jgi:hypothetical protein
MKYLCFFVASLVWHHSFSQKKLPVIRASSKNVAINDGGFLDKNAWSLSPATRPDVFVADRSRKPKWVIFYTDVDSIKVRVKPGTKFEFIVLLNGKDSCYTQIVSSIQSEKTDMKTTQNSDTIPFTLTAYNAISVKAVINNSDSLNLHFDIGSTDFRVTKEAILKKTHLLANQPDALAGKTKPNFNNLQKVFKVQMGNLIWENPDISPANVAAHEMDGRFGWHVFDGKIVEINYDKSVIVIHRSLPKKRTGFVMSKINFIHSLFCIAATIEIGSNKYTGDFLFDTGSDQAMILDSAWAGKQHFPDNLKLIKKSSFRDGAGRVYETNTVSVPVLKINGFKLSDIPTYLLGSKSPVGFDMNYFGNDVLKRFNIIIDLQRDNIYLKVNEFLSRPYRGIS